MFFFTTPILNSDSIDFFSDNHKILLVDIKFNNKKNLSNSILSYIFRLESNKEYYIWQIKEAVLRLEHSGFLKEKPIIELIQVDKPKEKKRFLLTVTINENVTIGEINIYNSSSTDPLELNKFLEINLVSIGEIYSSRYLNVAIHDFISFYQKKGTFFVYIKSEIKTLETNCEDSPIKINLYIENITSIMLNKISFVGCKNTSYASLKKLISFNENQVISRNSIIDAAYKKISRSGLYQSVYFEFIPCNDKNKNLFNLVIHLNETKKESYLLSTTVQVGIGLILLGGYANYGVNGTLNRLKIKGGYEKDLQRGLLDIEYIIPKAWNKSLFGFRLKNTDNISPYDQDIYKLTSVYSFTMISSLEIFSSLDILMSISPRYVVERGVWKYDPGNKENLPSELEKKYWDFPLNFLIRFDNLDNNYFPTRGLRTFLNLGFVPSLATYFTSELQIEAYFPLHEDLILALVNDWAFLFRDNSDATLFLYPLRRTSAIVDEDSKINIIRSTAFTALELRYRLQYISNLLEEPFFSNISIVAFFEGGSYWGNVRDINLRYPRYGGGGGLRYSPNELSDLAFEYPISINIGFRFGKNSSSSPDLTILTHRDDLYFVTLTTSF